MRVARSLMEQADFAVIKSNRVSSSHTTISLPWTEGTGESKFDKLIVQNDALTEDTARIKGRARRPSVCAYLVQDNFHMLARALLTPYRALFVSHSAQLGGAESSLRRILSRPNVV